MVFLTVLTLAAFAINEWRRRDETETVPREAVTRMLTALCKKDDGKRAKFDAAPVEELKDDDATVTEASKVTEMESAPVATEEAKAEESAEAEPNLDADLAVAEVVDLFNESSHAATNVIIESDVRIIIDPADEIKAIDRSLNESLHDAGIEYVREVRDDFNASWTSHTSYDGQNDLSSASTQNSPRSTSYLSPTLSSIAKITSKFVKN